MNTITTQEQLMRFEYFLSTKAIQTRLHLGLKSNGIQVRYGGHWMAILWNKNNKSYTVDKRLEKLLTEFKGLKNENS